MLNRALQFVACCIVSAVSFTAFASSTPLKEGWRLQSACKLQADGVAISSAAFRPEGWYSASVPGTVLATQTADAAVPPPYFGTNLRTLPGTSYPVGVNFSNLPMPQDSPYKCGWWYRREVIVPAQTSGQTLWLHFGGINYRADIWLNGKRIADRSQVAGAYRTYDFDITADVVPGRPNVLAVETFAPEETDLGINWVDWNPCPPDKDMGLWGAVNLVTSGEVTLRSPLAVTHFSDASLQRADLTVYGELHNATSHPVHGTVAGTVAGVRVEQAVDLAPGEDKTVFFTPEQYKQLQIHHPQVWWPYQMGSPHLETLALRFVESGHVSDEKTVQFGIREITSELTAQGYRLFRVNGKPLLIRGAGWSQDMLLREDQVKLQDQLALVRDMHLNTIRLEGKMETDDFFHLADQQGILVMLGWCCCDQWEHWNKWTPENYKVAAESLRSQMLRIRSHASLLVWLNGSDNPPPAFVEQAYLQIEQETHWPNPVLSSASGRPTAVSGKSGVKMSGPYDYVAPSYWLVDKSKYGGAFGFNTETSPGPAIPNESSLRKFLPANQLWPPDAAWSFHSGGGKFKDLNVFNDAMTATYGPSSSLDDYERLAQAMAYDGERAMFEAYSRNKYTSTGVIQWMLNNAWPSMIWHLYDYYLNAGGGYFGTKKACEPLHVQYSYDDHSIYVVNSTYQSVSPLSVSAAVYDIRLKKLFSKQAEMNAAADSSTRVLNIPAEIFSDASQIYFVELMLKANNGDIVSRNFYWVPARHTTFNWAKTDYTHTPALVPENMTALRSLPRASIEARSMLQRSGPEQQLRVELHNPSQALAFQVVVALKQRDGSAVLPVLWSDNYIKLLPGESRVLSAVLLHAVASTGDSLTISGWNVPVQQVGVHAR
ncbi:MAG: glycosyl hydrolase family 2 [Acidobacteria bacterium]|nr:glycosyl hydrolase family 2 [Acidobacteriota bacterium]MBW4043441.1 glycosyl hydrolase family 2 [Acidobacteriota bacterium]